MIVIPGPASKDLGERIAELLNLKVVSVEFKRFPDGESYIRLTNSMASDEVAVVQTTSPPQNENLIQLLLMADSARDFGAKSITAVIPYFAYARQDRRFRTGEALSVKTVVNMLEACGVGTIMTVNSHNPSILKKLNLPIVDLSAIGLLADHFGKEGFNDAFSVSLGKKGMDMALEADKVLHGGCDYIPTERDIITGDVTLEKKPLKVRNRDAIIFDDIISSGGTVVKAIEWIKDQGARSIYVACVHFLPIGDAGNRVLASGAKGIVSTDCVPGPFGIVSVAPLIAEALRQNASAKI